MSNAKEFQTQLKEAFSLNPTSSLKEKTLNKLKIETDKLQKEYAYIEKKKEVLENKLRQHIENIKNIDEYIKSKTSKTKKKEAQEVND